MCGRLRRRRHLACWPPAQSESCHAGQQPGVHGWRRLLGAVGAGVSSAGHNLMTDSSCAFAGPGDHQEVADLKLAAYSDDGTPGRGHFPPLPGSPAIDAGTGDGNATDQLRGTGSGRRTSGQSSTRAAPKCGSVSTAISTSVSGWTFWSRRLATGCRPGRHARATSPLDAVGSPTPSSDSCGRTTRECFSQNRYFNGDACGTLHAAAMCLESATVSRGLQTVPQPSGCTRLFSLAPKEWACKECACIESRLWSYCRARILPFTGRRFRPGAESVFVGRGMLSQVSILRSRGTHHRPDPPIEAPGTARRKGKTNEIF